MSVKSRLRAVNLNYRKLESPNAQATDQPNDREKETVMELGFAFLAIVLFIGLWLQT